MARILVIDGAEAATQALTTHLTQSGHDVAQVRTGEDGLRRVRDDRPDLVLVDLGLPDTSGTDVVRALRGDVTVKAVPIIMLSDRDDEIDRVVAFEVGVDDFVPKPFSVREVGLRVRAILRRRKRTEPLSAVTTVGGLQLDPVAHRVTVGSDEVMLSSLEFRLLATLYKQQSRVQTRAALLEEVWGAAEGVSVRTVDACVKRLRQKLGSAGAYIQTVRGVGYRFIASDELGRASLA